jgi:hypothetical protein
MGHPKKIFIKVLENVLDIKINQIKNKGGKNSGYLFRDIVKNVI